MNTIIKNLSVRLTITALMLTCLFLNSATIIAQVDSTKTPAKPVATMNLSYKITNGVKSIKVVVTEKAEGKLIPVDNLIVNLYYTEIKKYDPATGEGWMGNHTTNSKGEAVFTFHDAFYTLTANRHDFKFIARTSKDMRYEDLMEVIMLPDMKIDLSTNKEDSIITAVAKVNRYLDSSVAAITETPMMFLIKSSSGTLLFGDDVLKTDTNGVVTGKLPAMLPGNESDTITVLARYVDVENNGIIEVSKRLPWKVIPSKTLIYERNLWVTIIILALGTIGYLIFLLFKFKRLGKAIQKLG